MSDQPNTFTIDPTKEGEWLRVVRALGGHRWALSLRFNPLPLTQRGARHTRPTRQPTPHAAAGHGPNARVHLPSCAIAPQLGRGRGAHLKQIPHLRLQEAMTIQTGTPVTVRWSFREFALNCTRRDVRPLTQRMHRLFQTLLNREALRELTPGEDPTMGSRATRIEIIDDLAVSADHQGARAAALAEVLLSAGMFHLGDQLRRQSHALSELDADDETLEVIDEARTQIARTILLLDQAETAQAEERR